MALGIIIVVGFIVFLLSYIGCGQENEERTERKVVGRRNIVYEEKLNDERWKRRREEILKRDNFSCQWCGRRDNLQVHHKCYYKYPDGKMAEPWDYPDEKLITLCENCHRKWHEKYHVEVYWRKWGKHYRY